MDSSYVEYIELYKILLYCPSLSHFCCGLVEILAQNEPALV